MSYILDAIKKAERQRQLEQVPALESVVAFQQDSRRRIHAGKMALLVVVLMFAAAVHFFYAPLPVISQNVIAGAKNFLARISPSDPVIKTDPGQHGSASGPRRQTDESEKQSGLPAFSPDSRKRLQQMSFSVISYSENKNRRFVMSGSEILREGDEINGFRIVAIKKRSVILEVENEFYTFNL